MYYIQNSYIHIQSSHIYIFNTEFKKTSSKIHAKIIFKEFYVFQWEMMIKLYEKFIRDDLMKYENCALIKYCIYVLVYIF